MLLLSVVYCKYDVGYCSAQGEDRQCISMRSQPRSQFNVLNESNHYRAGEVSQLPRSLNHWQSDRENKFIKLSMKAYTSKWTVKKLMGIRLCDDSE